MSKKNKDRREKLLQIQDGTEVDGYIIQNEEPLGKGGSGIVYKATQIYCGDETIVSDRAIKFFLFSDDHADYGVVSTQNFNYEIRNITQLNHQNVLKVIDGGYFQCKDESGKKINIPYIVTDYVNGENLESAFINQSDNVQVWTENDIFELVLEILYAIEYLHANNFFHCDIAPKNIFLQVDRYNKTHAILGDLGAGHTQNGGLDSDREFTVIGTREYMSPDAVKLKGETVDYQTFFALQPQWDIWSTIKTIIELINKSCELKHGNQTWHLERLKEKLSQNTYHSVSEMIDDVEHLTPSSSTIYNLAELSEASHETFEKLIPCGSVFLSSRIRKLTKNPTLLRLMNVPQLLEGATTFPGANHTRYEHCLGTYELMRKAIIALLGNQYFTNSLSERNVILALLGALLSSIANYPYSYAIQEIRFQNKEVYTSLDRRKVFKVFLTKKNGNKSLFDEISELFEEYHITIKELEYVIYGKGEVQDSKDPNLQNLYLLLNSSIGVRIIDYLQRDAHHIGLSCIIDTDDLFSNLVMENNEFCIAQRGLPSVEEIIVNRYWMFKRIYWSKPNRANAALLKYMFYRLYLDNKVIETIIFDNAYGMSKEKMMDIIRKYAEENGLADIIAIIDFVLAKGEKRYENALVLDNNAAYGSASNSCASFAKLPYSKQYIIREKLEKAVCEKYNIDAQKEIAEKGVVLLIDMPEEHFDNKTGADIRMKHFKGNLFPLEHASGLIQGMEKNYIDQLRILRIYLHPDIYERIKKRDVENERKGDTFRNNSPIDVFLNEELQKLI